MEVAASFGVARAGETCQAGMRSDHVFPFTRSDHASQAATGGTRSNFYLTLLAGHELAYDPAKLLDVLRELCIPGHHQRAAEHLEGGIEHPSV